MEGRHVGASLAEGEGLMRKGASHVGVGLVRLSVRVLAYAGPWCRPGVGFMQRWA